MLLATWNINGLNARIDFLEIWLRDRLPDVVALQELKMQDERIPVERFEALGYHVATHGQKSWNGVAVLSRTPIEVVQRGLPGQEEMGARLLTVSTGGVEMTSVYCPNGKNLEHPDYERKLAWYGDLIAHLNSVGEPESGRVLAGDFNLCPKPIDSWLGEKGEGEIFHTEAERERFGELLQSASLVDLYRVARPAEGAFSWWDYRGGAFHRAQGLRIDFLLASHGLSARVEDSWTDREYRKKKDGLVASDHAPVLARLT